MGEEKKEVVNAFLISGKSLILKRREQFTTLKISNF
jgi:hypothetical protein